MSATVLTMRPMIVAPTGAFELRHQSACAPVADVTIGLTADRAWMLGNRKADTTEATRTLGRRST